MKDNYYKSLKKCFSTVKYLYSCKELDTRTLDTVTQEIRYIRGQFGEKMPKKARELFVYCTDTLLSLIELDERKKILDFVEVIREMPDIYLGERNIYSFQDKIDGFRKKYGKEYFEGIDSVYPRFTKKAPKNALSFFSPSSDEEFKKKHPVGYVLLVMLGILAFLTPLILFIIFPLGIFEEYALSTGWGGLAIVACLMMGVGFFNLVAAIIHQYLGHKLTIICIFGGGALVGISILFTFHPFFASLIPNDVVTLYFVTLLFLIVSAFLYFFFGRSGISMWLKRARKCTLSGKMTRGVANFLLYKEAHKQEGMGALYFVNIVFVLAFAIALAMSLLLGMIKIFAIPILSVCLIVYLLNIFFVVFLRLQENIDAYGTPIILIRKNPSTGRYESIFTDILFILLPIGVATAHILLVGDLYGVDLRFFN